MSDTQHHSGRKLAITAGLAAPLLAVVAGLVAAAPAASPASTWNKAALARLKSPDGKLRTLADYKDKKALVVVFVGASCPISNSYAEPLSKLAARYAARGVQFLAVNANSDESLETVAKHAAEFQYSFPVLKDEKQALADALNARVTPEAFVLDAAHVVRYHGRIDDQYASRTKKRSEVTSHDLATALDAVLAGKPVVTASTQAFGCAIFRPSKSATTARVTFHKQVEPILQERCQSCHRPNQVAPFSLISYADARSWASELKTFTASRQMPPWKAEPGHGDFMDCRRLSDAEIKTLAEWADAGAPEGSPKDAPAPKQWTNDWMLGKPDLVLTMPEEYHVKGTGNDDFRCFVLPSGLTEDKDVIGVEIRPGNPRVVHHVLNFIDLSGKGRELDAKDPGPGYDSGPGGIGFLPSGGVGGWAPGNFPRYLPEGTARRLPKGSDIVMQVHYHKTGKAEVDRTSVGLYFARSTGLKQLRTWPMTNLAIDIPPGVANHEVKSSMRIPVDVHALTITPHMHLLGRNLRVTATLPDGTKKDLVLVNDWDYRWQDTYRYLEPVALPKGTQLDLVAHYDNTNANPLNPNNPPKRVTFGEQTTDEMCFAFIELTMDQEPTTTFDARRFLGGGKR